jgi:hypothetical protein
MPPLDLDPMARRPSSSRGHARRATSVCWLGFEGRRRLPRVGGGWSIGRSVIEVIKKWFLLSRCACKGYGGDASVELVSDFSQRWRRCPRLLIDLGIRRAG